MKYHLGNNKSLEQDQKDLQYEMVVVISNWQLTAAAALGQQQKMKETLTQVSMTKHDKTMTGNTRLPTA